MSIDVRNLTKTLRRVSPRSTTSASTSATGELVALLGPSGSGKTTLLRIIAGLEFARPRARCCFDGEDVAQRDARERQVGFVFQHYALFRHMTVFENVAFGLRVRPRSAAAGRGRDPRSASMELLELVQLDGARRRAIRASSRAASASASRWPARSRSSRSVLLLDEPFGALDAKVRKELRRWLRRLHDELGLTSVFVTHDQEEALELADRVVVMNARRGSSRSARPREVYDQPATPFVYEFLGSANRLPCRVRAGFVEVAGGRFAAPPGPAVADGAATLFVRPHDLAVEPAGRGRGMPAVLTSVVTTGPTFRLQLRLERAGLDVEAEMAKSRFDALALAPGAEVALRPLDFGLFPADGADPAVITPLRCSDASQRQAAVA